MTRKSGTLRAPSRARAKEPAAKHATATRATKASERIARELTRRIVRGELKEGDALPAEATLMKKFGVSRPTMREAFRILEAEQLISVSRGSRGGARVHLPELDVVARYAGYFLQSRQTRLHDVFQARLLIEPRAANLFARRRTRARLAELHVLIERLKAHLDDPRAYSHVAEEFHLKVIEGSGNETLTLIGHVMRLIWERHLINAVNMRYKRELAENAICSHERLIELIDAGDGDGAEEHVRVHLEGSGKIVLRAAGEGFAIDMLY
jgi:DNA-binding FadR family transcriptional regulator